jgi:beta-lactamase class A
MSANKRNRAVGAKTAAFLALSLTSILAGSVAQGAAKQNGQPVARKTLQSAPAPVFVPPVRQYPAAPAPLSTAHRILEARIQNLGRTFNGDIGIAVKDIQTGYTTSYDGNSFFPQQSVSKFWVALTALSRADRGHLSLHAPVTLRREDLTLFHQPIAQQIGSNGYTTTISDLMVRALTQSDNTCNDFVLWKAGGPNAVRSFLADNRISGIRFGPGERVMQSRVAGMDWKQSYSIGRAFYAARNAVPLSVRRSAFENYIKDPVDGATPLGVVEALTRLKKGELLSPQSTDRLLNIMSNTKTGPQRLKGGLAPGWRLAHKTGTGQVLNGTQAGYNDIGIITAPDGRSYAIAVLIRRSSSPLPERMRAMQNTVRAVIDYAGAFPAERYARQPAYPVAGPAQPVSRTASIAAAVDALEEESDSE